jgi:sarcosine oxidase, subunit alpha
MNLTFEGQQVAFAPGDTVASALYRHGLREFSVSFEYRRPRGLLCAAGNCANCQMHVDGIPNVVTCTTIARDGMVVSRQVDDPASPVTRGIGLGKIPGLDAPRPEYEHRYSSTSVAVIGAGPEGIEAAITAATDGTRVWLIEKENAVGGRERWLNPERAAALSKTLEASQVTVLLNAACSGLYEGGLLAIVEKRPSAWIEERLLHLRTQRIIVATGSYEVPLLFENNDLPGIILLSGAQRLLHLHHIRPGERVLIAGSGTEASALKTQMMNIGCEVLDIVDPREVQGVEGDRRIERVMTRAGEFACDLFVVCGPRVPEASLLTQAGVRLLWDENAGYYRSTELKGNVQWRPDVFSRAPTILPLPALTENEFTCACHDIQSRDIQRALEAGFTYIETLKRVTKVMKGQCQSRMCAFATAVHCSHATGASLQEVGAAVSRPPSPPISLGVLAGMHQPMIRRTAMHAAHVSRHAVWTDMAGWKRPKFYSTPTSAEEPLCTLGEYKAIRERVGVIDVGTLGKLAVSGPDAAWLLDRCYTHRFGNLKAGRARYAVMCDEGGSILDDGMIARLSETEYFVSTTTANAELVQQIMEWQLVGGRHRAAIVNLTAGLAAMNVAGPLARQTLSKLVAIPLDAESFPYMHCKRTEVAGIPATLIRIGFVGETGWEIHIPANCGEELWNRVLEAGEEFGICPVGVETQRLLRLEKKHIIVGVDTDALSTPFSTGMSWVVKLDKEDFIGRAMLMRLAGQPLKDQLVGFKSEVLPFEGAAVVENNAPVGRVTSARYSPHCGTNVGLAWVPLNAASPGTRIEIETGTEKVVAEVYSEAFYDPTGLRLQM